MKATFLQQVPHWASMQLLLLVGLSVGQPAEVVADPQITAVQSSVNANQTLDTVCAAARDSRTGLRSVIATAWFKRWSQSPDENEPQKTTDGKLQLYFADGKYHVRFRHEKMLRRTIDLPQGVVPSNQPGESDVYRNKAGEVVDVPVRMADWKADIVFIVNDGRAINSTVFSPLIRPKGMRSESHQQFQHICKDVDITLADPAYIMGGFYDLEAAIKNLGTDAFQTTDLPDGGYRVTFRLKNAPNVRVDIDAFAKDGFNISAYRVFNEGQELPVSVKEATWKKINGQWIVSKLTSENRFRGSKHSTYTKEMIGYSSVEVNPWVDPTAFTINSMNPDWIPLDAPAKIDEEKTDR